MSFEENVARLYERVTGRPPSMLELFTILACINEARYGHKVAEEQSRIEGERKLYEEAKAKLKGYTPQCVIVDEMGNEPDEPKYYVIEDHPGMMWANAPLTAGKLEHMMREQVRMDERRDVLAPDIVARIRRRVEKAMTLDSRR